MDKIIRTEVKLNSEEIHNIELSLQDLEYKKYPLEEISKEINLKDEKEKKSDLRLIIKQENKEKYLLILYLDKIIFSKEIYNSIIDVVGMYLLRNVKGYTFLVNIDYDYSTQKYYTQKLSTLATKVHCATREIYNQIMYYDFSNEDELLFSTYCLLLLLLLYYSESMYSFELYEKKLNYIGYDIEDFYNKENKYSLDEIQEINNENNFSRNILNYLIGFVNFLKKDSYAIYNCKKDRAYYIDIINKICLKFFILKS